MANRFNWQLGHEGKGNVYDDGTISTWNTSGLDNYPHHLEMAGQDERKPAFKFYLSPEGGLHDGGISFQNNSPKTDDQQVTEVVAQHPAVWDARHDDSADLYQAEPRGEYGHAYNLATRLAKTASEEGWPDFHTELKLPRGARKKLRRWVDRLNWPEGSTQDDARTYHITILSMDEYSDEFAKWARDQIRGKVFSFKSTGMDIFGETVVVRLDSPEWSQLAVEWGEKADELGLEPRRFPGGPKAHVSVGKSPGRKWPQGIPNPHIKFETRMFNINKNAAAGDPWQPGVWGKGVFVNDEPRVWETTHPGQAMEPIHYDYSINNGGGWPSQRDAPVVVNPEGAYAPASDWDWSKYEKGSQDPLVQREFDELHHKFRTYEDANPNLVQIKPREWAEDMKLHLGATETTPDEDMKAWFDSFSPKQTQPLSLHHTDADQFTPQIVAPVVQTPHIDPPSKPYAPYNWAEEGWEESPLDRTAMTSPYPPQFDPSTLEQIREQGRAQTQTDTPDPAYAGEEYNYGCHYIAPSVQGAYPEARHESGIVLDPTEAQGYYDHHWNELEDGSILDVTNRQFHPGGNPNYIPYGDLGADPEEEPDDFQQWVNERTATYAEEENWGENHVKWLMENADALYHMSPITNRAQIEAEGLQPKLPDHPNQPVGVYAEPDPDNSAHYWGPEAKDEGERRDQWRIPMDQVKHLNYDEEGEAVWIPHAVRPELHKMGAIDTHICPRCGEDSDAPICPTCGYDGQQSPDDYSKMKSDWYDQAWSVPGNQPRPVPNQPLHWRDDHAKSVSLARKEGSNDLDHTRRWIVRSEPGARQSVDSVPELRNRESNSLQTDYEEDRSAVSDVHQMVSGSPALGGWHGF